MSAVSLSSLPALPDAGAVEELTSKILTGVYALQTAVGGATNRWSQMREVFDVAGAEGAHGMLGPLTEATQGFVAAMVEAKRILDDFAVNSLDSLKTRRRELAERIPTVNSAHESAHAEADVAEQGYWSAYELDYQSTQTIRSLSVLTEALEARSAADAAVEQLRSEIAQFRRDVDEAEQAYADDLGMITGGDEVRGAWGAPMAVSQRFWGSVHRVSPIDPGVKEGLADRLERSLSDAAAARITSLATASPEAVKDWVTAHPDFAGTVGFVPPERAARLWEGLAAQSTHGAESAGRWETGPLAQLFALAPFAIGNLNGLPAATKTEFNRETLKQMLAAGPSETQKAQLDNLAIVLGPADREQSPPVSLLSLFLETDDGSPRASIGFGDVDAADQITTLTHGINTDLGNLIEWSASAIDIHDDTSMNLGKRQLGLSTASVLFMEWDSGAETNVWNIERPDSGAARLEQLLRGFAVRSPEAQLDLNLHSLGTTAGLQMVADNPGLVQNAWVFGSAGTTEATSAALRDQLREGNITVYATHASDDFIAPLGRLPISEHPIDPRSIAGVREFSSDGGIVPGYGAGPGEYGERTEGHNAQVSTDLIYSFEGLFAELDDEVVGYLDPASQSYKQMIMDLVGEIESRKAEE